MQTNAQGTTHPAPAHKPSEALDKLADGIVGGFVHSIVHVASDALHKVEEVGEKVVHIASDTAHHALDSAKDTANNVFEKVIEGGEVAAGVTSDAIESVSDAAVITGVVVANGTEKAAHAAQHAMDSASVVAHHAMESASVVAHHAIDTASHAATSAQVAASHAAASAQVVAHHAMDSASNIAHHAMDSASHAAASAQVVALAAKEKVAEKLEEAKIVANDALDSASEAVDSAKATATDAVETAKATAADAAVYAKATASDAVESVKASAEQLSASAQDAALAAKDKASEVVDTAKVNASQAAGAVTYAALAAQAKASSALDSAKESASELSQEKVSELHDNLDSVAAKAADAADKLSNTGLVLTMDVVAHLQRIADRTGDALLHSTACKAHSAYAKGLSEAPGVHLTTVTPHQAGELLNLAIQTQDRELADFARYCQSVAATSQIAVEPTPGKILQEIEKGRSELQKQGRIHTGPGYGAAFASIGSNSKGQKTSEAVQSEQPQSSTPALELTMAAVSHIQRIADRTGDALLHDTARKAHSAFAKGVHDAPGVHLTTVTQQQANELLNLAIRTQDRELADFARYCQSVAASNSVAIEPTPGKIEQEIEKGKQELQQQGRVHTGPGYGAAFASISSQKNAPSTVSASESQPAAETSSLSLTQDAVSHLQRIADRTGDSVLLETARKAHSAFAKGLSEAPGVHLTRISSEQANKLLNLAIQTQDRELADFARYCQSVASTSQIAVEPTPGKIAQEIEKGRAELKQQGRTHNGPGYGAAFASAAKP